jgi:S1-C subfamily serine protease
MNDVPAGAYVQEVISGSPAEKVGIKAGDVITEIDGKKLADNADFSIATYINQKKIGDSVTMKFWRDNKEQTVTVKLEKKQE